MSRQKQCAYISKSIDKSDPNKFLVEMADWVCHAPWCPCSHARDIGYISACKVTAHLSSKHDEWEMENDKAFCKLILKSVGPSVCHEGSSMQELQDPALVTWIKPMFGRSLGVCHSFSIIFINWKINITRKN